MVPNQTSCFRLEQRSLMKLLEADEYSLDEIYRRMCDMYGET